MSGKPFRLDYDAYPFDGSITFSRTDTKTVDPSGAIVDENIPRFDHTLTLASVSAPEPVFSNIAEPPGIVLASGVDADGTTELMVWLHRAEGGSPEQVHALYVFVGGSTPTTLPAQTSSLSSPHKRRFLTKRMAIQLVPPVSPLPPAHAFYDLFSDTDSRPTTENDKFKAYEIVDAAVFHGAIVLALQVYVQEKDYDNLYAIRGFGFAISTDQGVTWQLIGDVFMIPPRRRTRKAGRGECPGASGPRRCMNEGTATPKRAGSAARTTATHSRKRETSRRTWAGCMYSSSADPTPEPGPRARSCTSR